jgi:hypothetical protein
MRALGWSVAVLLIVGGSGVAAPDAAPPAKPAPAKPAPAPEAPAPPAKPTDTIDISAYRSELIVLTDDDGTVFVVRPRVSGSDTGPVFVGDGKVFYEQSIIGASADGSSGTWSYATWAPRVPGNTTAQIWADANKKYSITCGQEKSTELRLLAAKEAARILTSAEFRPRLFQRRPHLLARDDDGTYYYVDIDRDERGNRASASERRYQHGHRVFVGKKGAMKELPMKNVVADSEGEIYQTKRGELRIVTEDSKTGTWVRGRKKTPLKILDRDENRYLIFRELGVYGFIGTACEEL